MPRLDPTLLLKQKPISRPSARCRVGTTHYQLGGVHRGSLIHGKVSRGSLEKGLAGYLPRAGSWVSSQTIALLTSGKYTILHLPQTTKSSSFLHLAYFIARFFFFPPSSPMRPQSAPIVKSRIDGWQPISCDKGSDTLTKFFRQWNISMASGKKKPLVDFFFSFSFFPHVFGFNFLPY